MSASVAERRLGELRWIVLRGPAPDAFAALGRHLREDIHAVLAGWDTMTRLRRHAARPPGRDQLAAVSRASAECFPGAWAELGALADGAGVPLADLALMNFRGDLGTVRADPGGDGDGGDAAGCSDLAWRRRRSFIAHNEDDAGCFDGRCAMLTMDIDGLPPVAAFCKPGFLPSNNFTVTGSGLAWSIDHMPAPDPGPYPGRHFVARGLQQSAATIDQALAYLGAHPAAGGYAYTIGDRSGRVVSAETLSGQLAWREVGAGAPLCWHTNHGRYVAGAQAGPGGTSRARGEVLQALAVPAAEPGPAWFARVLAGAALPDGVRADRSPASDNMTLCTFLAALTAGEATLIGAGARPVTIPLADLVRGEDGAKAVEHEAIGALP